MSELIGRDGRWDEAARRCSGWLLGATGPASRGELRGLLGNPIGTRRGVEDITAGVD